METDIRSSCLYREAEALYKQLRRPGSGQISDAAEVSVSADGKLVAFAGAFLDKLEGSPATRICLTQIETGQTRVVTLGPNFDKHPRFARGGCQIAFISDRHKAGDFQLYLLDPSTGAVRETPRVDGWVEYLHWSPNGDRILLGVAGHGADIAGGQGAVTSARSAETLPAWMPKVETGDESYRWRRTWVYDVASDRAHLVGPESINIWEANWCGDATFACITSSGPGEGLWYTAALHIIDITTNSVRLVYRPHDQLGCATSSPSGKHLAFIEALCSDRGIVAGTLKILDVSSGAPETVDTLGADITHAEWRSDKKLLVAGHRAFETTLGLYDAEVCAYQELWRSTEVTTGGRYVTVSGFGDTGNCTLIAESFTRAPELGMISDGKYRTIKSFDLGYADHAKAIAGTEAISWRAPDGLEIQGWLLRPNGTGPYPLVTHIHGGPVWQSRPVWLGRFVGLLLLLKRGYAVFFPNARGSAGRGQEFARRVLGDIGGADTYDHLSGLDHLVNSGIADPGRLGVTGVSYGGFMSSWLISQDARFAAAVVVAPHTNQVTEHLLSNIPHFISLFVGDRFSDPGSKYIERSPIMHAHKVRTPTLNVCGMLDRCTPAEEAMQFHNALLENGVDSVLVSYPEEGHGIRKFPAVIDFAARQVDWFERHMPIGER